MSPLDRLIAIEEIKSLKASYFRAVDLKDAALLRSVFTDEATADFRGSTTDPATGINAIPSNTHDVVRGADQIIAGIMQAVASLVTVHHASTPEIEIVSATTATAIWPMFDLLRMPVGAPVKELIGWGHYHETYRRDAGSWKIASLRLTRLRVDIKV